MLPDADFIRLFTELGATKLAIRLGMRIRSVHYRRERLERRLKTPIKAPQSGRPSMLQSVPTVRQKEYPWRLVHDITNGHVVVFSDCHYWPGTRSLMHRALLEVIKEFKPVLVIANGDVIDAPSISRHASIGWEKRPQLVDEIENVKDRLSEIEKATFKTRKIWTLGNHDQRFEMRLANVAPEYAKIHGVHLKDHFPAWEPCWQIWLNDEVIVLHRYKSGEYAIRNNPVFAGKSTVTGHLHRANVFCHDDANGTRYGVDTGCVADTDADAFVGYMEGRTWNWRSGFGLLTFKGGRLMLPELVLKWDDEHVQFRGKVMRP